MAAQFTAKQLVAALKKAHGEDCIQLVGQHSSTVGLQAVCPTGQTVLDRWALGVGGIPWGRLVEVLGPESSGKTTLANVIMAAAQREGEIAYMVDAEQSWEPAWAEKLGVNLDDLLFDQPSFIDGEPKDGGVLALIETALEKAKGKKKLMIVIDSVAALMTKAEFDQGLTGEAAVAEQARIWSSALRKLVALLSQTQSTVVLLNQIRMKIGVKFGNPEITPGGNAIKFYATMRLRTFHGKKLDSGRARIMGVQVIKNKVAPPHRVAELKLNFDGRFSNNWSILTHAKEIGCADKKSRDVKEALENLGWGDVNAVVESDEEDIDGVEADSAIGADSAIDRAAE